MLQLPTAIPTAAAPPPPAPVTEGAKADSGWTSWLPWLGGLAAFLIAGFAGLAIARRRRGVASDPVIEFERPIVPEPVAAPEPEPEPQPLSTPPPTDAPAAAASAGPLAVELAVQRLNISLVAATLSYQLRVTNTGDAPVTALAIEADMIGAHASLPVERQIASPALRLEPRHRGAALAPGETAEFKGEFRVPLTQITPIRRGEAAFLVPLARLRIEAARTGQVPLLVARTHVIGEIPDQPGAALRPFRLDLGPRTFSRISHREVG